MRRLYRSDTNKVFGGVCGGIGEYFDIDPVLVRIVTVIVALAFNVFGVLAYLLSWIIIPKQSDVTTEAAPSPSKSNGPPPGWRKYLPGIVLVLIGAALLLHQYWWWVDFGVVVAVAIIAAGIALIGLKGTERSYEYSNGQSQNGRPANGHNGNGGAQ